MAKYLARWETLVGDARKRRTTKNPERRSSSRQSSGKSSEQPSGQPSAQPSGQPSEQPSMQSSGRSSNTSGHRQDESESSIKPTGASTDNKINGVEMRVSEIC